MVYCIASLYDNVQGYYSSSQDYCCARYNKLFKYYCVFFLYRLTPDGDFEKAVVMGEFTDVDWEHLTQEEMDEIMSRSVFEMEPGKCLCHELKCVGLNSLWTDLPTVSVCQRCK